MIAKPRTPCINRPHIRADDTLIVRESAGVDVSMAAHSGFNLRRRVKREEQARLVAEAEESAAARELIKSRDPRRGAAANATRRRTSRGRRSGVTSIRDGFLGVTYASELKLRGKGSAETGARGP